MKKMVTLFSALAVSLTFLAVSMNAEAARLGGGKSYGRSAPAQRSITPPAISKPAPAVAPSAATPAKPGMSRWLAPLAGFALGAALASMFGMEAKAGIFNALLVGLAVMLVLGLVMRFMRRRQQPALAGAGQEPYRYTPEPQPQQQPVQYQAYQEPAAVRPDSPAALSGMGAAATTIPTAIPADFPVESFEREAKVNFRRLQEASDRGNLEDLRAFTTSEMFAHLAEDLSQRKGNTHTEVLSLEAKLDSLGEDPERQVYVAAVLFTADIKEDGIATNVRELWYLEKSMGVNASGWLLAGITQQ